MQPQVLMSLILEPNGNLSWRLPEGVQLQPQILAVASVLLQNYVTAQLCGKPKEEPVVQPANAALLEMLKQRNGK